MEFLHGDNFVQAHIKAAEALQQPDSSVVRFMTQSILYNTYRRFNSFFNVLIFLQAGEAYFISDGHPINNFEFFRPLV